MNSIKFSKRSSCIFLVKYIPRYFIFLSKLISQINFSVCLLLMYKKAAEICIFFFILTHCWKCESTLRGLYWMEFSVYFMHRNISLENTDILTFLLFVYFYFVFYLNIVAATKVTTLNRSRKGVLFLGFRYLELETFFRTTFTAYCRF